MNISAIIIAFNPLLKELFGNILTYSSQVSQVVIVDNSTDLTIKEKIQESCTNRNIDYLDMRGNKGVATALNAGFDYVMLNGADWVLTMDQDSCFVSSIEGYKSYILNQDVSKILLLAPIYHFYNLKQFSSNEITHPDIVIQSGCLVNVQNYLNIGTYRDDFFIDFVDYEYCLRGKSHNLILSQVHSVVLKHALGDDTTVHFLGLKYNYSSSSPIRYYYMIRNGLATAFIYYNILCVKIVVKTIARVVLFEDNKKEKLKFILKGGINLLNSKYYKLS